VRRNCPDNDENEDVYYTHDEDEDAYYTLHVNDCNSSEKHRGTAQVLATKRSNENELVLDSGSAVHVFRSDDHHQNIRSVTKKIEVGDGNQIKMKHCGDARLPVSADVKLKDVWVSEDFVTNLISVGKLDDAGCRIVFEKGKAEVTRGDDLVMSGTKQNGIYLINQHKRGSILAASTNECEDSEKNSRNEEGSMKEEEIMHKQFGHIPVQKLKEVMDTECRWNGEADVSAQRSRRM
jgi:hypothetical protein